MKPTLSSLLVVLFLLGNGKTPGADKPGAKPANESLRKELLRLMEEDQAARKKFIEWLSRQGKGDMKKDLAGDQPVARSIREIDRKNIARMKEIVDKYGWPGKSLVGADGANAAWLLVQHADQHRTFQKKCLELVKAAFKQVLVGEGKKQIYGSQCQQKDGKLLPSPIEDEANVDKRRKEVGLNPLAEYAKQLAETYKSKDAGKK
ncbi:MAG: hypothetical protein E6K70_25860 [Planctomycetota bacterium]|nr:MAG: hypothetical protein E6K70_25860 [Planctomycetota bacterium]